MRRPWVPYRQWLRQREAERLRVPGAFRNLRARHADERRAGVRMPPYARIRPPAHRDDDFRRGYNQAARGLLRARRRGWADEPADPREAVLIANAVRDRNQVFRDLHRDAREIYEERQRGGAFSMEEDEEFDDLHGDYGGRYEEFLYQGDKETPEETQKRLRDDPDDVSNLPVISPGKKVKFEEAD